tara:strand:- start:1298 stop:2461 length:1164 start_codon:yes stop_codon:yes gene_type:complete
MVINKRKICIVTGSRAEYGLLRSIIKLVDKSPQLELQLVVTGMHLSSEFGFTVKEILDDNFFISKKLETLLSSDTPIGVSKSIGLGIIGFSETLEDLKPDLILLLGDRYEILSIAICALIAKIPIAHISGGEITEGAIDESIRHSITKMSSIHFVAAEEYKKRVIQLGEDKTKVFNVGGLGAETINKFNLLTKNQLEKDLKFKFNSKNILITFHPETLDENSKEDQIDNLLYSLNNFKNLGLIFTMPNADNRGKIIHRKIQSFCNKNKNSIYVKSLGQKRYYSCLKIIDGVVGNSSSGICEAPSFNIGTVNIGDRQKGRLRCHSIIDVENDDKKITNAIKLILSDKFKDKIKNVSNPYLINNTSKNIVQIIKEINLDGISKKKFFDL